MNSNANDWIEHASFGLARVSEDRGDRLRRRIHHLRGEDDSKGRAVAESLKIGRTISRNRTSTHISNELRQATRAEGGGDKSVQLLITLADAGAN